jgi:hypothetical protein
VHLNIVTTAATAMLETIGEQVLYAVSLPFLTLLSLGGRAAKSARHVSLGALVLALVFLSACGGGFSEGGGGGGGHAGTPTGSYNVQVNASSGTASRQLTVRLIVE